MSYTPASKSSVTKTLFTGMAQLLEAKKDFNFDLKKPSDVVTLTNEILQVFHDIEPSATQKLIKGVEKGNEKGVPIFGILNMKRDGHDLGTKNNFFTYFLLSTSQEEFHNMFLKFFHEFDNDRDFVLSQFEFKEMLNFFCKKENIGRDKIEKVFKKLFPINFKSWYKLDKILDRNEDHELGLNLSNGVFQQMKCTDKQSYAYLQNKKPVVEYVKLLPLFTALYSQLISVRINKRKENLEMTRGVDDKGDKIRLSESSLCDKFERLGLVYDKDDPVILTYRDIENALILFKNYYTSNFGQQQLDLVLSDVQQKYRYSKKRGDFIKPPVFDKKFLTYLAFKVSIHGICHFIKNNQAQMDQFPIIQEFVYWNVVIHADKFDRDELSKKFMSFSRKNPKMPIDQLFSVFIVKIIPLIPRQIGQNVLNNYLQATDGRIDIQDFANRLYDLLVEQAEQKLHNYLEMTFNKISQQTEQMLKTDSVRRPSVFNAKHASKPSQDSEMMSRINPKVFNVNGPIQDHSYAGGGHDYNNPNDASYNHLTHKPSVMSAYRADAERELMRGPTDQDRSQAYSRSGYKPSEIPSISEINLKLDAPKLSKIPGLDNLDLPRESFHFERRSVRDKSSTNINPNPNPNHSQSIILTDREGRPTREPLQQDYLNSCFIMETFLHNFLYEKTFANNNITNKSAKKKETAASKRMSVYGNANGNGTGRNSNRSSRRMTKISESINSLNQDSDSPQESPQTSPERATSGFFKNYGQDQQAAQENDANARFRKTRTTTLFKKKRDSFDDLRNEFGDVEGFNSDMIFFTKKDTQKKQKGRCACGMEACNVF